MLLRFVGLREEHWCRASGGAQSLVQTLERLCQRLALRQAQRTERGDERRCRSIRGARQHPTSSSRDSDGRPPAISGVGRAINPSLRLQTINDIGDGAAICERSGGQLVERETIVRSQLLQDE